MELLAYAASHPGLTMLLVAAWPLAQLLAWLLTRMPTDADS